MRFLRQYQITLVVYLLCSLFLFGCASNDNNNDINPPPSSNNDDSPPPDGDNDNELPPPEYVVYGLNFSCYTQPGQNPNMDTILSPEQIRGHLNIVAPYTEWVRLFGTTLGLEAAPPIAHSMGLFSAVGAWLDNVPATNETEMNNLITLAGAGYVDIAIIGSETLYRRDLDLDELIAYIELFQREVPDVPVTTAETYDVWIRNPELIDIVDVVAANFYSYWEGIHIDEAAAYVHSRYQLLVSEAGGKEVIVSEAGWPSDGDTILQAEPTPENAAFHFLNFVSWARAEGVNYFYFEAFDEPWKAAYEGPQGAHWGIWTSSGVIKDDMERVFNGETIPDNWTSPIDDCFPGGPGTPEITLTYIPPIGSEDDLEGRVRHVESNYYGIAVYIYVNGWWTKPYWADPVTTINCNGNFVTDIATSESDQPPPKLPPS
jgi:exo-beta-1,3-glucanase (GH17 family)